MRKLVLLFATTLCLYGCDTGRNQSTNPNIEIRENGPVTDEITKYCPDEAKMVILINLEYLQNAKSVKSIIGRQSLFDYWTSKVVDEYPDERAKLKDEPSYSLDEYVANKASKIMVIDLPGFLNYAIIYQGMYETDALRTFAEKLAKRDNKKLETTFRKEYTLFEVGEFSLLAFGNQTIMIGTKAKTKLLRERAESANAESKNRCLRAVRRIMRDETAFAVWAIEDADRRLKLFDESPYKKTYDLCRGSINLQGNNFTIKFTTGFDNLVDVGNGEKEIRKAIKEISSKLEGIPLADHVSKATFDNDDKNVTVSAVVPARALQNSLGGLIRIMKK